MSGRPTIIVAGLGRCGTTMLMQMLASAGVPTVGAAPDWEDAGNVDLLDNQPHAWREAIQGRAVKVLDAQRYALPELTGAKLIWMVRDPREQARSMLKLVGSMFGAVKQDRASVRALTKSINRDTVSAVRALDDAVGGTGIALKFENVLQRPAASAAVLCEYLGLPRATREAMVAAVRERSPACLPYLAEFPV